MGSLWTLLIVVPLIFCFILYGLGPIVVFVMLKFPYTPSVVVCDPQRESLPDDARRYFAETYAGMTGCGFQLLGTFALPDVLPNVRSLMPMYLHPDGHMAMATVIVAEGLTESKVKYCEFATRYANGVSVTTSNSPQLSAFKTLPHEFPAQLPMVHDLAKLFLIHRKRCQKHAAGMQPELTLQTKCGGRAVEFLSVWVLRKTFEEQVGTGYLRRTADGFAASPKGALVMAWQESWPLKSIRVARMKRRANELLAEFA